MSERILCSFSGGRTSAMMSKLLKDFRPQAEIIFVFANTGEEDSRTLDFVDRCDKEFDLNLVWVEAKVFQEKGIGTSFSKVSYADASRNGEPYEQVISKYGIPNTHYPNCNRELKLRPIHSYMRSMGWNAKDYSTAIGIRADEIDRMSSYATKDRIIYPLVKLGVTKQDVLAFWKTQAFDLYVPEHLGNCKWCWKKSFRKLMTLAVDHPEHFDFPKRMEDQYAFTGPGKFEEARRFFRGAKSVDDIFTAAKQPFEKFVDGNHAFDPDLDVGGACNGGESCDIFTEETDREYLEYDL